MREIKFRAYDIIECDMIYRVLPLSDGTFLIENANSEKYVDMYPGMDDVAPNNFKLMQYTGLKDKNGKEIYEGDMVNMDNNRIRTVEYDETEASYVVYNQLNSLRSFESNEEGETVVYLTDEEYFYPEVLGNIYENKDLLDNK